MYTFVSLSSIYFNINNNLMIYGQNDMTNLMEQDILILFEIILYVKLKCSVFTYSKYGSKEP